MAKVMFSHALKQLHTMVLIEKFLKYLSTRKSQG